MFLPGGPQHHVFGVLQIWLPVSWATFLTMCYEDAFNSVPSNESQRLQNAHLLCTWSGRRRICLRDSGNIKSFEGISASDARITLCRKVKLSQAFCTVYFSLISFCDCPHRWYQPCLRLHCPFHATEFPLTFPHDKLELTHHT